MKRLWLLYAKHFEALNLRERLLIMLTILIGIVVFGYLSMIEPLLDRQRMAERRLAQQGVELSDIQQKVAMIQTTTHDQDAAKRVSIETTQRQIAEINSRLKTIGQTLVAPDKVAGLLGEILKRNHRVELISLRNLPVGDLLERKEAAGIERSERIDPSAAQAMNILKRQGIAISKDHSEYNIESIEGPLFKHGVEITVVGNYGDLMNYLAELEKMPQRMLWSSVKLSVEEYPRARMTLTVYTLSLDRAWLTV